MGPSVGFESEPELLTRLCNKQKRVTIFLRSGYQFQGVIVGFDDNVVAVESGQETLFVYKSFVSTIAVPERISQTW